MGEAASVTEADEPSEGPPRCPVCGGTDWRSRYEGLKDRQFASADEFDVWACEACGVWRLWPVPADMSAHYPSRYAPHAKLRPFVRRPWHRAWGASFSAVPAVRRAARYALRFNLAAPGLWPYVDSPPRSVLDYGCGSGAFLGAASQLGMRVMGVDLSEKAVSEAGRRGIPCRVGSYEDLPLGDERFDLVRMWHVLEHVADPVRALVNLGSHLEPGGKLVVAVPNAGSALAELFREDWYQLDAPRHLWGFTEPSLRRALEEAGYEVEKVSFGSTGYAVRQSMRYALRRTGSTLAMSPTEDLKRALDGLARVWDEQGIGDAMVVVASLRPERGTGD